MKLVNEGQNSTMNINVVKILGTPCRLLPNICSGFNTGYLQQTNTEKPKQHILLLNNNISPKGMEAVIVHYSAYL